MSEQSQPFGKRYAPSELIGRGGMADVFRARDLELDREVAIKSLRDVSDVDSARFACEAELLSRLQHPAIVQLLDSGVDDGRPWLALELVEGRTMSRVLMQDSPEPSTLAEIAIQVADALAHAHDHGIVHRDVKPSNVLVTDDGQAKLTDFGVARVAEASASLTLTGHTIGTAAYLSPEQVRGEMVSGASDVYALGLVLLEALTGERAYGGPPVEAALARLSRAPLIPTSLPTGWSSLIASMTQFAPSDRPSAHDVGERLRALADGVAPAVDLLDPTSTIAPLTAAAADAAAADEAAAPTSLVATRRRRRRGAAIGTALVMVAAVVFGGVVLARGLTGSAPVVADPVGAPTASTTVEDSPSTAPKDRRTAPVVAEVTADATPVSSTTRPTTAKRTAKKTAPAPKKTTSKSSKGKAGKKTKGAKSKSKPAKSKPAKKSGKKGKSKR